MVEAAPLDPLPEGITKALVGLGLLPSAGPWLGRPLTGGVSSDIWRVEAPSGPICAKRALEKLKVAADWRAPTSRNLYEARWLRRAAQAAPGAAPMVLGQDEAAGVLALEWLDPADHPTWKERLLDGDVAPDFAAAVGDALGRIHSATAIQRAPDIPDAFPTDAIFHDIRLEPYLLATARAWPGFAAMLEALARRTATTKRTLVHGDVSPKNILVGPNGPVFIDAECAWAGDPAFDVAFCLNHLLLKRVARPDKAAPLGESFGALWSAYAARIDWEPVNDLEARTASLLPALFLARVDGKSPAEYVTAARDKARIRQTATALLLDPPERVQAVQDRWRRTKLD